MSVFNLKYLSSFGLAVGLSAFSVAAPSRTSSAGVVYSYDGLWPSTHTIASQYDPNGGFVSASGGRAFTGLDRNGDEQTSYFEGGATAFAQYGQLRSSAWASLTNSFYNTANAANGIPGIYAAWGQVRFSDTLKYTGMFILPTFKVRYTYFVHGTVTGSNSYGALGAYVGANYQSFIINNQNGSNIANYYSTATYELNSNLEHEITTNFLAGFQVDSRNLPDGANVAGEANFDSTVTLTNIEMFDESGNPFYDFGIESESGHSYPVPEPASLIVCGVGLAAVIRRRSRKG